MSTKLARTPTGIHRWLSTELAHAPTGVPRWLLTELAHTPTGAPRMLLIKLARTSTRVLLARTSTGVLRRLLTELAHTSTGVLRRLLTELARTSTGVLRRLLTELARTHRRLSPAILGSCSDLRPSNYLYRSTRCLGIFPLFHLFLLARWSLQGCSAILTFASCIVLKTRHDEKMHHFHVFYHGSTNHVYTSFIYSTSYTTSLPSYCVQKRRFHVIQ